MLSNHDRPRIAARVGPEQARIAAMLLLTLRGTPTLYYGDEIGIGFVDIPLELVKDPWAKREPGLGVGRDPSRTPMQWDASAFAGFSTHEPWLPLTQDHETRNVATMSENKKSILSLVRNLLHYRREHFSLQEGTWRSLSTDSNVLAYERRKDFDRIIVVLNFSADPQVWPMPECRTAKSRDLHMWRSRRRGSGIDLTSEKQRGPTHHAMTTNSLFPRRSIICSPNSG